MERGTTKKDHAKYYLEYFTMLIFLAFLRSLFIYVFILPNGFAPGGFSGISSIVYNAVLKVDEHLAKTVFDAGITTLVFNIPVLIIAAIKLDKRFSFNTFCVVIVYSAFMTMFSYVNFPQYVANGDSGYSLLAALFGGAGCGLTFGIMIRHNMCAGGTDIIGKLIYQKNPAADVQWWVFALDAVIALFSAVLGILDLDTGNKSATYILTTVMSPVLYSFISMIASSEMSDVVANGYSSHVVFTIITKKPEELAEAISTKLRRGVTMTKVTGYYTKNEYDELTVIVNKRETNAMKTLIDTIDPNAFTYISKSKGIYGTWFKSQIR